MKSLLISHVVYFCDLSVRLFQDKGRENLFTKLIYLAKQTLAIWVLDESIWVLEGYVRETGCQSHMLAWFISKFYLSPN